MTMSTGISGDSERPSELISLLDSEDNDTVEQTKSLIHENLYKSKDPSLLNALVDCFLDSRSNTVLNILTNIHEARTHSLFEKLNDCLRHSGIQGRVDSLTLLGYVVRRQPSWLYKIVKTSLFESLIKCLKSESDVLFLVYGILTITTLLPLIPTSVGSWLNDLFDIYTRLAAFLNNRPGNIPDVYLLHLHVAVYNYFHRLYAMYPNNFVSYLKTLRHDTSKQIIFHTIIKPMLEHVRLHPCLVTETPQSELGKHRWRKKEPQDIVIECQNISLDPVDRLQSENSITASWASQQSQQDVSTIEKSVNSAMVKFDDTYDVIDIPRIKERRMSDSATQTGKSLQSGDSGTGSIPLLSADDLTSAWSPSDICGLSTPPSSQMSPSTSNQDLTSSLSFLPVSQCSTPAVANTPGDSPTTSLGGDIATDSAHSKLKRSSSAKLSSGFGTPILSSKPHNHDSIPSYKAIHSALLKQNKDVATSPTVIENQTSTPRSSETSLTPQSSDVNYTAFSFERQMSEMSAPSEPITPIDKSFSNHFFEHNKQEDEDEDQEQLTCSKDIPAETAERILRHNSYSHVESPTEPPPSIEVSFNYNASQISMENLNIVESKSVVLQKFDGLEAHQNDNKDKLFESKANTCKSILNSHSRISNDGCKCESVDKSGVSESSTKVSQVSPGLQNGSQQIQSFGVCYSPCNCPSLQLPESRTTDKSGDTPVTDSHINEKLTPNEVLDNYIRFGSVVHHEEFSRISMVNQSNTDWTHFGGEPPLDEIVILRGQIQLLHHQLLYERHKCEQHAIRNRRLIGKTFKAVQYQEELQAIKDHLRLQEEKMRELTEALNKQTEDNRKLRDITSGWDNQQQTQLRNLLNENAQLQYVKGELKSTLAKQKNEHDALQMELNQAKSKILTLDLEMSHVKPKVDEKAHLRSEIDKLTQELVVMGEINQQHKDAINVMSVNNAKHPETDIRLHACQKELAASKHMTRKQKAEVDALHSQIADLELSLKQKDIEMRDLKKFADSLNGTYLAKLKALETKYDAQKKINQSMEAHILNLRLALKDSTTRKPEKQGCCSEREMAGACGGQEHELNRTEEEEEVRQ